MERYVIHVTKKCNMKCVYCYEEDKTSEYTWDEIKVLIDNIVKYNKEFSVEFLGGEPMLRFDLIKKSIDYMESMKDLNISDYLITTNGSTELSDEIVDYFRKNEKVYYAVSLDGGYFANQLRIMKGNKNSYDIVMPNIKKMISELGANRVPVHIVSHPYNVALLAKSIDLFYQEGIRKIGVGIIETTIDIGREFYETYQTQLFAISDSIKAGGYEGLDVQELTTVFSKQDSKKYIKDDSGKVIAESYGRMEDDFTCNSNFDVVQPGSARRGYIYSLRKSVYDYHNGVSN